MRVLKITGVEARKAACIAVMACPDGWLVKVSEPTRSLEQNALLHAELQEISERVKWDGQLWTVDEWKRLLTAAWMRAIKEYPCTPVRALDHPGLDFLYRRTSTLTVPEMNDLIAYIQAWKAGRPEFE